jgi:glycosyltransferase involved in cell wall biosynthesis
LTQSISIIIPAFNEEQRLGPTLERIRSYLEERRWDRAEILVVDDGSTDATVEVAQKVGDKDSRVRLLRNPGNRGKGYSVRHGMLEATAGWLLFTDADLSAPIEELDKLLIAVRKQGVEVAIGSRAVDRSLIGVRQSAFRENAGRLFNLFMRLATGLPFWDTQCGFKLFEREAARRVFRRQRLTGFGFDVEVLFIARLLGYGIVEVPVRWDHAPGTKVSMVRDSLRMFTDLARIRWNQVRGLYDSTCPKT